MESFDQKENFKEIEEIPMLPVGIFKRTELKSIKEEEIFKTVTSSGTSAQKVSKIFLDEKMQPYSKEHLQRSWKK